MGTQKLVHKEIDLRGTIAYVRDHPAVIKMGHEGKVDLKPFITGRIAMEDLVEQGFDTLINHKDPAVKVLVHCTVWRVDARQGRKDNGGTPMPPSCRLPCLLATARVAGNISRDFSPYLAGPRLRKITPMKKLVLAGLAALQNR